MTTVVGPVLQLTHVGLVRDGRPLLHDVTWTVEPGQRWVVLGPNGCGKTTLIRIASLYEHPSSGTVRVLGHELGHCDLRTLRTRVGVASQAFADLLRPDLSALDVVVMARHAALEPWWHTYSPADRSHAADLLRRLGVADLAARRFGSLSSGERQRVQLARTLMASPDLLLLDEPTAGLDLGGREDFVARLSALAADPAMPATVLVTHHVEEVPVGTTHVLLLRAGGVLAQGPLADTLTGPALSECFGVPVHLETHGGRYRAWADPAVSG